MSIPTTPTNDFCASVKEFLKYVLYILCENNATNVIATFVPPNIQISLQNIIVNPKDDANIPTDTYVNMHYLIRYIYIYTANTEKALS